MKYGLRSFLYVFAGLLMGALIACLIIGIKWNVNQKAGISENMRTLVSQKRQMTLQTTQATHGAESEQSKEPTISENNPDEPEEPEKVSAEDNAEITAGNNAGKIEENHTEDKTSDQSDLRYGEDDLVYCLGHDFSELQSRFAGSEQVLSAEYQYFKEECLAVAYDDASREVLCIENDGEGINPVTICGIRNGMTREQVYDLIMFDLQIGMPEEDAKYLKFNSKTGTVDFSLEIVFDKDYVSKITCRKSFL